MKKGSYVLILLLIGLGMWLGAHNSIKSDHKHRNGNYFNLKDFILAKKSKIIDLPSQLFIVDQKIYISSPVIIKGGENTVLLIKAKGSFIISLSNKFQKVVMQNIKIIWNDNRSQAKRSPAFRIVRGTFIMRSCNVTSNLSSTSTTDKRKWLSSSSYKFISAPSKREEKSVILVDNVFASENHYSTHLLYCRHVCNSLIARNTIYGFHGALYIIKSTNTTITENKLVRNSFGNIVVSGQDIQIKYNKIFFHGDGTSGDGITASSATKLVIEENLIWGGSCYGISVLGNGCDISIKDNFVGGGITTGLYIVPSMGSTNYVPQKSKTNIKIEGNIFANNTSYALLIASCIDVIIKHNYFTGRGKQIYQKNNKDIDIENNYVMIPYDLTRKHRFPYGSLFKVMTNQHLR